MKTEIVAKGYNVSQHFKDILEQKLEKLEKFVGNVAVKVHLIAVNNSRFTIEITVPYGKSVLRSEVTGDNMYSLLDIIVPKIETQVKKHSARQITKDHKGAKITNVDPNVEIEKTAHTKVVKVKKFDISMTTPEEAIAEMDLTDHSFYVFVNANTNMVSVVYKRNDGDYGLIEPQY